MRDLVMRGYETARQIIGKNRNRSGPWPKNCCVVESLDADGIKAIIAATAN